MKLDKIIVPVMATALILGGCGSKENNTAENTSQASVETSIEESDDDFFERDNDTGTDSMADNPNDTAISDNNNALYEDLFTLSSPYRERPKQVDNDWLTSNNYVTEITESSYTLPNGDKIDDSQIKVPYINIISSNDNVNKINEKLKNSHDLAVEVFNRGYTEHYLQSFLCDYECYTNNNIGSLVFIFDAHEYDDTPLSENENKTDVYESAYYMNYNDLQIYNLNLTDGSEVTYEEALKTLGLNRDDVDKQICDGIERYSHMFVEFHNSLSTPDAEELGLSEDAIIVFDTPDPDSLTEDNIAKFHRLEQNGRVKFFIDDKGKLNVLIPFNGLPADTIYESSITMFPLQIN